MMDPYVHLIENNVMLNLTKKCTLMMIACSASFCSLAQTPEPTLVALNVTLNNGDSFSSEQAVLSLNQNTPTTTLRFPSGHIAIKDPVTGDAIVSRVTFEWQAKWLYDDMFSGKLTTNVYRKGDEKELINTCVQPNASNIITMQWREGYDPLVKHKIVLKELDLELFNADVSISSKTAQSTI